MLHQVHAVMEIHIWRCYSLNLDALSYSKKSSSTSELKTPTITHLRYLLRPTTFPSRTCPHAAVQTN
jgi:hypothetical protein